jgi:hypothetical protein
MSGKLIHIFNFCKSVDIKIQLAGNAQIYLLSASPASNTMRLDIFHPKKKKLTLFSAKLGDIISLVGSVLKAIRKH